MRLNARSKVGLGLAAAAGAVAWLYPLTWPGPPQQSTPAIDSIRTGHLGVLLKLPDREPWPSILSTTSIVTLAFESIPGNADEKAKRDGGPTSGGLQVQTAQTPLPPARSTIADVPVRGVPCIPETGGLTQCFAIVEIPAAHAETLMSAGRVWIMLQPKGAVAVGPAHD